MTANTVPLTYNTYIAAVAALAVVDVEIVSGVAQSNASGFNAITPQMLNYAELRIQRDMDILPLQTSNTYALTPNNNQLQIPVDDFVTLQTISVQTGGQTYPLMSVTKEFLQNVYGSAANLAIPTFFAMYGGDRATGGNTYNNVILGPWPDAAYPIVVTGTIRAPSLYLKATTLLAATATTFISTYYPDMLIMASMIYASAYQRNWGKMSDDPAMAMSYEAAYRALLPAASTEEMRKRFESSAWSSMAPAVAASPGR